MARKIFVGQRPNPTSDPALRVSFDGGSIWSSAFGGGGYWTDVYNITSNSDYSYIYVATNIGLYMNYSGGASGNWRPATGSGKSRNISNVTKAVVNNNKLWVSEGHPSISNSGGLYSASSLDLSSASNSGFGTVVDYIASKSIKSTFLYGNNLYAVGKDSSGGVIYIIDTTAAAPSTIYTGAAYLYQNTNANRPNDINDVYVNANGIYLATNTGLYFCPDLIPNGSSVFTKIYDPGIYDIVRKVRYYNNTIYLASSNGLQYATDNGASTTGWTTRTTTNGLVQNSLYALHVDSSGIYIGYGGTVSAERGMSVSTNNGSSWTTTLTGGVNNSNVYSILSFNVNSTPTNITLSNSSVDENLASGTTVGTLTTTDADAGDTFTYSLSGTDASSFSITGNTLKTNAIFNYEVKSSYSISITSTDSAGATYTKAFTISVTNVNEAPTNITLSASSIAENNALNAVIGTLTTTDPDAGNTFTYTLGGTDASSFNINVVGGVASLRAAEVFNYETKSSYSISITSTDQGGLTYTKAFTISVTNVNEAPTNITLSASSITENNAVNAVIGTLSVTDPDVGDSVTFSIISGGDKFNISGTSLRASVVFDYETATSHSVTVRATDGNGLTYDKAFTISILNDTGDDTFPLTNANSVTLSGGITIATVSVNPTLIPVLKDGNPLSDGSIVRYSVTGQKFIKVAGSSTSYEAIPVTPPANWNWSQELIDAWAVLQNL
jgi:hypothetical protein